MFHFVQNISIKVKIGFMILVPVMAISFLAVLLIGENFLVRIQNKNLIDMINISENISLLVHEMQKERGNTAGFVGSKGKLFADRLAEQRRLTDEKLAAFNSLIKEVNLNLYDASFSKKIQDGVNALNAFGDIRRKIDSLGPESSQGVPYYTSTIATLLDAVLIASTLSTDNTITKGLISYINFLLGKERAGLERATGNGVLSSGKFTEASYVKFIELIVEQKAYFASFYSLADENVLRGYEETLKNKCFSEVSRMEKIMIDKSFQGDFGVAATYWFDTITEKIDYLKITEDAIVGGIKENLNKNIHKATMNLLYLTLISLFVLISTIAFGMFTSYDIINRINIINVKLNEISHNKNLTESIELNSKDEIGKIAVAVNNFVNLIKSIFSVLQEHGVANKRIASVLVDAAETIDDRIRRSETLVSENIQLGRTIGSISTDNVQESIDTKDFIEEAIGSVTKMQESISSLSSEVQKESATEEEIANQINELAKDAEDIREVLTVIGEIADQTNLLALNAAIEAARAGEHGRGFAVVADEVRKLAEKTQKSLGEINNIIQSVLDGILNASRKINMNAEEIFKMADTAKEVHGEAELLTKSMSQVLHVAISSINSSKDIDSKSQDMISSLELVNGSMVEVANTMSDMRSSSDDIEKHVNQLNDTLKEFKL